MISLCVTFTQVVTYFDSCKKQKSNMYYNSDNKVLPNWKKPINNIDNDIDKLFSVNLFHYHRTQNSLQRFKERNWK